jgi:tRNA pseudouridine32 synthase/23S rRNA pseudouridine746 synthase
MAIISTGKTAQTKIKVIKRSYYSYKEEKTDLEKRIPVTLVDLSPISGRRHQLRVHLKYIGHPIVGDFNYEETYTDTFRMMLHAHKIVLPLPGREELVAVADDPFIALLSP